MPYNSWFISKFRDNILKFIIFPIFLFELCQTKWWGLKRYKNAQWHCVGEAVGQWHVLPCWRGKSEGNVAGMCLLIHQTHCMGVYPITRGIYMRVFSRNIWNVHHWDSSFNHGDDMLWNLQQVPRKLNEVPDPHEAGSVSEGTLLGQWAE